jgi:hypothetical protein
MKQTIHSVLLAAQNLPREELPELVGALAQAQAVALARLTAPVARQAEPDRLLDISKAASRLGVSKDYLYRNHSDFSFTRRVGRTLRFSSNGIEDYIRHQNGLTARRQRVILPAGGSHATTSGQARQ